MITLKVKKSVAFAFFNYYSSCIHCILPRESSIVQVNNVTNTSENHMIDWWTILTKKYLSYKYNNYINEICTKNASSIH